MERRVDLATGLYYDVGQEEIARRHHLVREYMEKKDIAVLLVLASHKEGYRWWLTGVDGTERRSESCFVVPRKGDILHVTGGKMAEEDEEAGQPVGAQPDAEEAFKGIRTVYQISAFSIRKMMEESGGKRLGLVHGEDIRAQLYDYLEKFLPNVERVDVTEDFAGKKAVKSPEEQKLIREAVRLQERVLEGLSGYLKPGMREAEAVRYARYLANHLGSGGIDAMEYGQVELISWKDRQMQGPLDVPGRCMEAGDMMEIKLRIRGNSGFYGFIARRFSFGEPAFIEKEIWQKAILLQEMAEEKIKPGKTVDRIEEEIREEAKGQGISLAEKDFSHGIGYCVSEGPDRASGLRNMPLQSGMVLAVEPEIVDERGNKACCGDVYAVTDDGIWRMSISGREIKILE